ncbi:unnamed protein product [Arabis nemorensis]|uniref:Uncharacterized protein n=1 Tax=Arabis nemorensis TaxID=586526 RepID=A0A565BUP7_9BRAS|nr:unnamed protein product [Arabis nemorensis]
MKKSLSRYNNVIAYVAETKEPVKTVSVKTEAAVTETAETDEGYSDEEEMPTYEDLLQNFINTCSQNVKLIKEKKELGDQIEDLKNELQQKEEEELISIHRDLEETRKGVKMLNSQA